MGAECAWKVRRGATARELQEASLKVALGVTTKWEPVLREVEGKEEGSQTVKQVG